MFPPDFPGYWAIDRRAPRRHAARASASACCARSPRSPARRQDRAPPPAAPRIAPRGSSSWPTAGLRSWSAPRRSASSSPGVAAPLVAPPPGIELTTLAARPDLVDGVHAVALETFQDIPGGDAPMAVGDLAEFRARDVDRPSIPHDAFFVAVDTASGRAVGYAASLLMPGSTTSPGTT